jgi:hypothetical protein
LLTVTEKIPKPKGRKQPEASYRHLQEKLFTTKPGRLEVILVVKEGFTSIYTKLPIK